MKMDITDIKEINMTTYEDIRKANESIRTTDIKGKDYAEVNQRIKAFRMNHPCGTVQTEIVSLVDGVVTMKASIFDEEGRLLGTGYAQEKESSSFINKTSFIENCETSAWGRALGACGYGIDVSIASAEEVQNAINNQEPQKKAVDNKKKSDSTNTSNTNESGSKGLKLATESQIKIINNAFKDASKGTKWLKEKYNVESADKLTIQQASELIKKINEKEKKDGKTN